MLLEMQTLFFDNSGQGGPADMDPKIYELVKTATDKGIVVVMGAGNNGIDLDATRVELEALDGWTQFDALDATTTLTNYRTNIAAGDNGAIIVGATQHEIIRPGGGLAVETLVRNTHSNYGTRVHVHAWGDRILTAGVSANIDRATVTRSFRKSRVLEECLISCRL